MVFPTITLKLYEAITSYRWMGCKRILDVIQPISLTENGTRSSRWYPLLNLERASEDGRSSWTVEPWSTRSFTSYVPAAPGGCCPKNLGRGKRSIGTSACGVRTGPGGLF